MNIKDIEEGSITNNAFGKLCSPLED